MDVNTSFKKTLSPKGENHVVGLVAILQPRLQSARLLRVGKVAESRVDKIAQRRERVTAVDHPYMYIKYLS